MEGQAAPASSTTVDLPLPRVPNLSLAVQARLLLGWLVLTDVLALMVAFRLAHWIRFDLGVTLAPEVVPDPVFYPTLQLVLPLLWVGILSAFHLYEAQRKLGGLEESARAFHASTTAAMLVIVTTFIWSDFVVSRMWLVSAWLLSFLAVAGNRFLARRVVYALRRRGLLLSPAIIVGTNEESASLAASLGDWRGSGVRLIGVLASTSRSPARQVRGVPHLGTTHEVSTVIERHGIEEVIVAITAVDRDELLRVCEEINHLPRVSLRLSSGLYELLTTRVSVRHFGTLPLLRVDKVRLTPGETLMKGLVEYPLALAGVVLLSPLLLAIAALVKLDSPGPVLHRRYVLGASRRRFAALKFRTMCVDGHEVLARHPEAREALMRDHKLQADPRVTRVGRWLRAFSLDELPQLFNVLRGQMSLVGPRMITPEELKRYGRQRLSLHTVKPGITGLWQVSGRSDLSYEERVRIDMYYVRNYSIWLDLQILFIQTLPAVLNPQGRILSADLVTVDHVSKRYRLGLSRVSLPSLVADWARRLTGPRSSSSGIGDELSALDDVTFGLGRGESLALVGPNGAGKTTLLKMLANITRPSSGSVTVRGRLSALIELGAGFHPDLTGRDNAFLNGAILGIGRKDLLRRFDEIVEFSGLERFIDTPVKRYSSGMVVRLGFAIAACLDPEVLLVDEVLAVGDAAFSQKCLARIRSLINRGTTMVFVSHNLYLVKAVCQRGLYLRQGRVQLAGPIEEVIAAYERDLHQERASRLARRAPNADLPDSAIEITRVDVVGPDGTVNPDRLASAKPATIRIHYAAYADLGPLQVSVFVRRADGLVCCMSRSKLDGVNLDIRQGAGTVSLCFERLQLVTGAYFAEAYFLNESDSLGLTGGGRHSPWFSVSGPGLTYEDDHGVFEPAVNWAHDTADVRDLTVPA